MSQDTTIVIRGDATKLQPLVGRLAESGHLDGLSLGYDPYRLERAASYAETRGAYVVELPMRRGSPIVAINDALARPSCPTCGQAKG